LPLVAKSPELYRYSGQAARRFTGGATELEVAADTFRGMVLELDRRFPGLGRQID
jgi:hypothetical protein